MKRFLISFIGIIAVLFTVNAETYTHSFKNGELTSDGGTVKLTPDATGLYLANHSDFEWTASKTEAGLIGWNATKGIQFGSKNNLCKSYSIYSDAFNECTITRVTVYSSIGTGGDAKLTIKAGDSASAPYTLTTTNTAYTYNCNTKGNIEISWNATDRAYYVQKIEVEYTVPSSMIEIVDPEFKTPEGIYADMIYRVTVETEDQTTALYYTTDGTDPNYEDYVSEKEGCTTATSKTYVMYFDNKKALKETTTIKVLAVKTDGDAVYKSEIVEATYIVSPTTPYIPATEISEGKRYAFIANDSIADALHTDTDNGYLEGRKIAKKGKYIEAIEYDAFIFTAVEGGYTIQDAAKRYMFANSDNTFGFAEEKPATGAVWNVTIADGKATIKNGDRTVYYSKENDQFGCYTSKSGDLELPALYMLLEYPTATITPAKDKEVKELQEITITCEDGIDFAEGTVLETSVSNTGNVDITGYKVTTFTCTKVDEKTLKFTSDKPVSTTDNIELYINLKGTIYLNPSIINMVMPVGVGFYKEAIAHYRLVGNAPTANILNVAPIEGENIGFTFTFDKIVNGINSTKTAKLYLEGSTELIPLTFNSQVKAEKEPGSDSKILATLETESPINPNGKYILEIPYGYFLDRNGREVKDITINYDAKNSSLKWELCIEDIISEGENSWSVYNTAGIKILETEDAEQLNALPKGIYIINGKKWIVE